MTSLIGRTLAHYRITAAIGAGGMGEVYRATDTKLGRDVAIKVLPAEVASDAERLARFEREAKLLASLNHTNIAHVYGFESAAPPDGPATHFLAMELVEGSDLADRLKRGPVPVDEAVAIARQVAEALEEAHDKGIVHRDLKPGNVKATPDGKVKVLDFGLAKAYAGESASGSGADLSQSPTLAHTGTAAGLILGTAAYMSPEQARGKAVDKRADIWAFGVLLYEMLAGRQLFAGETVSDVLAAVLTREPDWGALPATTPPGLRRLLRRCLERDPRRRLHDIADAHFDLEEPAPPAGGAGPGHPSDGAAARSPVRRLVGAAALTLLGVLAGALAVSRMARAPAPRPVHFATALSLGEDLMQRGSGVVLSPDGTRIVFRSAQDGRQGLFLRSLDQLDARFIPGTENATAPFFSPDGAWLAFSVAPGSRGAELMKTRFEGGAPIHVGETASSVLAGFTVSGSWSEDGEILFSGSSPVIQRVSALGGQATAATELDASRGEQRHVQPVWLPGGRGLLYVADAGGLQDVMVASGDGGKGRVLVQGGTSPRYAATGYLLFARDKTLLAAPFDLRSLQLTGEPFPVVEGLDVAVYGSYRIARFDLSPNGTLAYLVDRPVARNGQLVFVDRQGKATAAFEETGTYLVPRISPDGARVAYAAIDDQSGQRDVWVGDLKRGTRTRLTLAKGASTDPIWTPDGQGVTYASTRDQGSLALYTSPADGSGEPTRLSPGVDPGGGGRFLLPGTWLRDVSGLVFHAIETSDDIGILRPDSGAEEMLLASRFAELEPSLSPDDRFMAYVSDESGRREVYVRSLGGAARRVQVSSEGGDEPVWSPRGGEMFYRQGPRMIAVPVSTASGGVTLGTPAVLFEGRYDVDPFNHDATNYDVTPDGQRFLMVRPVAEPAGSREQLNVVVNWYEKLTGLRGGQR
jgi:Tol biopolymer transport system component